jgi:hypothetical protein
MLICFVRLKTSVSGGMHVPCGPPTVSCFANAWKHVPAGEANNMICLEIYHKGNNVAAIILTHGTKQAGILHVL